MQFMIPINRLHAAIAWLNDNGFYEESDVYHHDRVRVNVFLDERDPNELMSVNLKDFPALTPDDLMIFKLTFCGQ